MNAIDEQQLYSIPQAACALGVSEYFIRECISAGTIVSVRPQPTSHPRIPGAELMKLKNPRQFALARAN